MRNSGWLVFGETAYTASADAYSHVRSIAESMGPYELNARSQDNVSSITDYQKAHSINTREFVFKLTGECSAKKAGEWVRGGGKCTDKVAAQ